MKGCRLISSQTVIIGMCFCLEQHCWDFQLFHLLCLNESSVRCSRSGRYGSRALWDPRDHSSAHSRPQSYSPSRSPPQNTHREGPHTNRPYKRPYTPQHHPQYRQDPGVECDSCLYNSISCHFSCKWWCSCWLRCVVLSLGLSLLCKAVCLSDNQWWHN